MMRRNFSMFLFSLSAMVIMLAYQNCDPRLEPKTCEVGGVKYREGPIPSTSCNKLWCSDGNVSSTLMLCQETLKCSYEGNEYVVAQGERFLASDGCNTCQCGEDESVTCTKLACESGLSCQVNGNSYMAGETFLNDGKLCTCGELGEIMCTTEVQQSEE